MPKKCIICGEPAEYCIKDTSEYYCKECAAENFSDLSMLVKVDEQAKALKKILDRAIHKDDFDEGSHDKDASGNKEDENPDEDLKNSSSRNEEPEEKDKS